MPEHKKKALKGMLTREVEAALSERPDLDVVKLADGAKDNWTYLSKSLPEGREGVDFYHASEHLSSGLAAAYGENAPRARAQHEKLRRLLKEEVNGVEKVIRSLVHLKKRFPRRKKIADELGYFRRNRHRIAYAALREDGFPIGSGVVEARLQDTRDSAAEAVRHALEQRGWAGDPDVPLSSAERQVPVRLEHLGRDLQARCDSAGEPSYSSKPGRALRGCQYESYTHTRRARKACLARLLREILEVDPLLCPRCGGALEVIAVIADPRGRRPHRDSHRGRWRRRPLRAVRPAPLNTQPANQRSCTEHRFSRPSFGVGLGNGAGTHASVSATLADPCVS